jgi:hypothetical protein
MPFQCTVGLKQEKPDGILHSRHSPEKGDTPHTQPMTKSFEVISEAIRNPKHPFRKAENQPKKPQKHRYERRKIKEYLHLGDWVTGGPV